MQRAPTSGTQGVVIGRFMPPHSGHRYLIDFARHYAERLFVLVCTLESEPIPGELRYRWMKELFPTVNILHITEENPEANKDNPRATAIWAETVTRLVPGGVDFVFASEPYGWKLSDELGARFVPVDPARHLFPVSATQIRDNPMQFWRFIPEPVRPYFLKRVCVVQSPDDRGSAELTRLLAERYGTVYAEDYSEFWQRFHGRRATEDDLSHLVNAQMASETSLSRRASRLLFCKSDLVQIAATWKLELGEIPQGIEEKISGRRYDLYLISDGGGSNDYVQTCREILDRHRIPSVTLHGDQTAQLTQAYRAVDTLIGPVAES